MGRAADRRRGGVARMAAALAGAALLGLAAFVLAWFQPQKLVIDDRVDEALPGARPAGNAGAGTPGVPPPMLQTVSVARFHSHEHTTHGRARVLRLPDGRRYVRFEGFRTSNGPLLRVYLSAARADGRGGAFDERFVDLGGLKGNVGDQNYLVPRRVRLRLYRSVVVWCKRFGVPFAAAPVGSP